MGVIEMQVWEEGGMRDGLWDAQEKQKHMNFLQGISNKPEKKDDKKGHKQKSQRVDPLLKKVMQKGFAQAVLNETFGHMQALSKEEDGNLA
ncbi:hypothetical protein CYMTET_11746 [Cymbomonas tetramitiformis]|uniref:Uncharacterized protein n=1 Tax=Cymbomonas tetramitiformis TaxID=36881 RepID=A0AAE0LCR0_9CHLO|nr:hypothetical protein CYMTET_11746 [Cymbomonas tetramitiformis]